MNIPRAYMQVHEALSHTNRNTTDWTCQLCAKAKFMINRSTQRREALLASKRGSVLASSVKDNDVFPPLCLQTGTRLQEGATDRKRIGERWRDPCHHLKKFQHAIRLVVMLW